MKRLRLYLCKECGKYGLIQLPKSRGSNKLYGCKFCNAKTVDVDTSEWKDTDGDIVTTKKIESLDGENELALEETILVSQQAEKIVALIPSATRHLYSEDTKKAALEFYIAHKELFQ